MPYEPFQRFPCFYIDLVGPENFTRAVARLVVQAADNQRMARGQRHGVQAYRSRFQMRTIPSSEPLARNLPWCAQRTQRTGPKSVQGGLYNQLRIAACVSDGHCSPLWLLKVHSSLGFASLSSACLDRIGSVDQILILASVVKYRQGSHF
jgi:hypothetical protein